MRISTSVLLRTTLVSILMVPVGIGIGTAAWACKPRTKARPQLQGGHPCLPGVTINSVGYNGTVITLNYTTTCSSGQSAYGCWMTDTQVLQKWNPTTGAWITVGAPVCFDLVIDCATSTNTITKAFDVPSNYGPGQYQFGIFFYLNTCAIPGGLLAGEIFPFTATVEETDWPVEM